MIKTKIFKILFCLVLMQSIPAYAVTEPGKVVQHSIRNVQTIIETIKVSAGLVISLKMSLLQGMIGSIKPNIPDSLVDVKNFAPTLPKEAQSLLSSGNVLPKVRSYVEKNLKSRDLSDVVADRDALVAISERLNISSMEAIGLGRQTAAKLNGAVDQNKELLKSAAYAVDQHTKQVQEAALGVKALESDTLYNQLQSRKLETLAQRIIADVRNHTTKDDDEEEKND